MERGLQCGEHMPRLSVLGLLLLPLVAACSATPGDPRENIGAASERIVNGTPSSSALDSVVFLGIGTDGFCTGTLIAPNLVITARHCVQNMDETTDCGTFTTNITPSTITVTVGVNPGTNADAAGKQAFFDTDTNGCSHDIALLLLDREIAGAKTAPVRFEALKVGETVKTVGYGDDGSGTPTSGRYEKNGLAIDAVGPASYTYKAQNGQTFPVDVPAGELVTGESTCFGDSGGPLMDAKGAVVGVTSRGIDDSCIDRPSIYSDTATHAALIQEAAKTAGHPLSTTPPTSSSSSGGSTTGSGGNDNGGTDNAGSAGGAGDDGSTTAPKKTSHASQLGSSGCSASPSRSQSPLGALALAVLGLALARRKRS
ncbi:MAG TPA: trypsin-like serine protease [Labilithrix sp.]